MKKTLLKEDIIDYNMVNLLYNDDICYTVIYIVEETDETILDSDDILRRYKTLLTLLKVDKTTNRVGNKYLSSICCSNKDEEGLLTHKGNNSPFISIHDRYPRLRFIYNIIQSLHKKYFFIVTHHYHRLQ